MTERRNNDDDNNDPRSPPGQDGTSDPPAANTREGMVRSSSSNGERRERGDDQTANAEEVSQTPLRAGNIPPDLAGSKNRYANGRSRRSVGMGKENIERADVGVGGVSSLRAGSRGKV